MWWRAAPMKTLFAGECASDRQLCRRCRARRARRKIDAGQRHAKTWQAGSVTAADGTGYPSDSGCRQFARSRSRAAGTAYDDTSGWRVKAGQRVQVIANGEGFSVNAEGQAMNNAAVAQNARVRMTSGQIVSGTVDSDGNILINL